MLTLILKLSLGVTALYIGLAVLRRLNSLPISPTAAVVIGIIATIIAFTCWSETLMESVSGDKHAIGARSILAVVSIALGIKSFSVQGGSRFQRFFGVVAIMVSAPILLLWPILIFAGIGPQI